LTGAPPGHFAGAVPSRPEGAFVVDPTHQRVEGDRRARTWAAAVAAVFLVVGVLGFVPGVTSDYDQLSLAGHESSAELLGIFQVSVLHNVVHLLFGVAGLALARTYRGAVGYLLGGGVVYLVLWVYGLLVDHHSSANFVPVNSADNWLHLGLGLVMVGLGYAARAADSRGAPGLRA
jgi:4-hydroxybenzoate polyprenyltransferase